MRIAIFVAVLGSVVTGVMFCQCFHSLRIGHVPFSRLSSESFVVLVTFFLFRNHVAWLRALKKTKL